MKAKLISILKIALPLAVGVYLIWYFNDRLSEDDKDKIWFAFQHADYTWLIISITLGWFSHLSRAYRWLYMLESVGKRPSFWNSYHSVMIGYIMNLVLPRAGEAARAAYLSRYEDIPFDKTFGTILAERVIDVIVLATICAVTIVMQLENLDAFQAYLEGIKPPEAQTNYMGYVVNFAIVGLILAGVIAYFKSEKLRNKVIGILKGLLEGLQSILKIKKKWYYLGHTLLIWVLYVAMFLICYQSHEPTSDIPLSIMMAGFIAGAIGIVLVQGGIGVYPILIAVSVSLYLGTPEGADFNPDGYALGWLIWVSQTIMIVSLGGISMLLMPKMNKKSNVEPESNS